MVWCFFFTDYNTTPTKLFCFVLCCWMGCGNFMNIVIYSIKMMFFLLKASLILPKWIPKKVGFGVWPLPPFGQIPYFHFYFFWMSSLIEVFSPHPLSVGEERKRKRKTPLIVALCTYIDTSSIHLVLKYLLKHKTKCIAVS